MLLVYRRGKQKKAFVTPTHIIQKEIRVADLSSLRLVYQQYILLPPISLQCPLDQGLGNGTNPSSKRILEMFLNLEIDHHLVFIPKSWTKPKTQKHGTMESKEIEPSCGE